MKIIVRLTARAFIIFPFLILLNPLKSHGEVYGVTCFDGSNHPPGFDCRSLIKSDVQSGSSRSEGSSSLNNNWQYQQDLQRQERARNEVERQNELRRLQEAEEAARRREQARRKQFEEDKKSALSLLKLGAGELGLKGMSGGGIKLKGVTQNTLKLKEPLFSKGHKGSAPPDLRALDSQWPIVKDLSKVQGGTSQALKTANLRTHALLDALGAGHRDWETSIRYLKNRLADSPSEQHLKDALNLLRGYHAGYLGAKDTSDDYYKYGVRKWLDGDFDHAARSFARASRENPDDMLLLASFAHTLGLRDGSGRCQNNFQCSHIDIPTQHIAKEMGIVREVKVKLDKLRAEVKANPHNFHLRATLNHLEGWAGYNDYMNIAADHNDRPMDNKTWGLTSQGLDKIGERDYAGAFKDFSRAYKDNEDDRGILFVMSYTRGLSAAQGDDVKNVPDALWDKRTSKVYEEVANEIDGELLSHYFLPKQTSASALVRQLKNTEADNPFFGNLADEIIERLIQDDLPIFK